MACKFQIRGVSDPAIDSVLGYVEVTPRGSRNVEDIYKALEDEGVLVFDPDMGEYEAVTAENDRGMSPVEMLEMMNESARENFQARRQLFTTERRGKSLIVQVNEDVLDRMELIPGSFKGDLENNGLENPIDNAQPGERTVDRDNTALEDEVDNRKENLDLTTKFILNNIEEEIRRIERKPTGAQSAQDVAQLKVLKSNMRKIKKKARTVADYFDFVDYIATVAGDGSALLEALREEVDDNLAGMSKERKLSILQHITELGEKIDAFYNIDSRKSLLSMLQTEIARGDVKGNRKQRDFLLEKIQDAIVDMEAINAQQRDVYMPVLARVLHSFAPIQINEDIDARIAKIKETGQTQGLRRRDPQWRPLMSKEDRIALNIKQLEGDKIGVKQIEQELKETHNKVGWFSLYLDPATYSSEIITQLVAEVLNEQYTQASDATIDLKRRIAPKLEKFIRERGGDINKPEELYRGLYTVVMRPVYNAETKTYKLEEVLELTSEIDKSKWYKNMYAMYDKLQKTYSYPEDPSELEEWIESDEGQAYMSETAKWWRENSEPVENARAILAQMRKDRTAIFKELQEAIAEGNESRRQALSVEYNNIKREIQQSVRTYGRQRVFIGKLAQPVLRDKNDKPVYENQAYTRLDQGQKEFLAFLKEEYALQQKMLGKSGLLRDRFSDVSDMVPTVRKSSYDRMSELGFKDAAKNLFADNFTPQETDTEFGELRKANGEPVRMIPQYFTNYVPASQVSKDLVNTLIKFGDMAHRYKAKSEIHGVVTLARAAMQSREQLTMTSTGNYAMKRAAHALGIDLVDKYGDPSNNAFKQFDSFLDNMYYGQSMISKRSQQQRLAKIIDGNKVASVVNSITAVNALAGSWLQAGNQLIMDSVLTAHEGYTNQFYSRQDVAWARSKMYHNGFNLGSGETIWGMYRESVNDSMIKKNKLAAFLEWADAFQEMERQFSQETGTAVKKALTNSSSWFVLQNIADIKTTSERTLAVARATKGKIKDKSGKLMLNKKGEPADLWDLFTQDEAGWKMSDQIGSIDGKQWRKGRFTSLLRGLNKRTNQLRGSFDKPLLNRHAFGSTMMMFRSYLIPGYRKRFGYGRGGIHTDVELGRMMEGYYQTAYNFMVNVWDNKGNFKAAYAGMDELSRKNLGRFLMETVHIKSLMILSTLLAEMLDDDDENYALNYLNYQALRLHSEMAAFRNTGEAWRILQSPTATVRPILRFIDFMEASKNTMLYKYAGVGDRKDIYYQRKSGRFNKGDLKWTKKFYDTFAAGPFKSTDPAEAAQFFEQDLK